MNYKDIISKYAYACFMTLLLTCTAVFFINGYFGLKINTVTISLVSLIFTILITAVDNYKKNYFLYIFLGGITIISSILCIIFKFNIFKKIFNSCNWLLNYNKIDETTYSPFNANICFLIITMLVCILFYLLQKKQMIRLFIAVVLLGLMIFLGFKEYNPSKIVVFCMMAYIFSSLSELSYRSFYKIKDEKKNKTAATFLIPVFILSAFLTVIMPSSEKPIQWTTVKAVIRTVSTFSSNIINDLNIGGDKGSVFSLGVAGYSEETGKLGGDIKNSTSQVLTISTYTRTMSGIYLIGSVMDTYDNNSWTKSYTNKEKYNEYEIDTGELLYSLYRSPYWKDRYDIVRSKDLTIQYNGIATRSLFYPLKTNSMKFIDKKYSFNAKNPSIIFNKSHGYPLQYDVDFYELNLKNKYFIEFIKSQENYNYTDSKTSSKKYEKIITDYLGQNPEKLLAQRSENINEQYLNLPPDLSLRVKDLSNKITKGIDSKYEKLKAIEEYLNKNYTYTTSPGGIPEGRELSDYFLFDSKEGYCTYFATSMAVLARCQDIPTRYIQGFVCNYENEMGYTSYVVKNENAHAWVEAYIEGIGWIPFEPTSSYTDKLYKDWVSVKSNPPPINYDNYYKPSDYYDNQQSLVDSKVQEKHILLNVITIISIIVGSLVLLMLSAFVLKVNKTLSKYSKADIKIKYIKQFHMLILYLSKCGLDISDGETISAFSNRINHIFRTDELYFKKVSLSYMKLKYGSKDPSENELVYLEKYLKLLEEELIKRMGKIKFSIYKLRLLLK